MHFDLEARGEKKRGSPVVHKSQRKGQIRLRGLFGGRALLTPDLILATILCLPETQISFQRPYWVGRGSLWKGINLRWFVPTIETFLAENLGGGNVGKLSLWCADKVSASPGVVSLVEKYFVNSRA